jgi:hypothetical protein
MVRAAMKLRPDTVTQRNIQKKLYVLSDSIILNCICCIYMLTYIHHVDFISIDKDNDFDARCVPVSCRIFNRDPSLGVRANGHRMNVSR